MGHLEQPLIVGAGPVGLAAALFLAKQQRIARVVEMLDQPAQQSKALAVNPRTLEILESTGLTEQMLKMGSCIYGVRFYRRRRPVAAVSFEGLHTRYPFMLALSQATTERLLAQALQQAGGAIERGVKLVQCRSAADHVEVALEPSAGGPREIVRPPWLLAADGAHSVVRQQLGVGFPGSSLSDKWYLADVPLKTGLAPNLAHVFFLDGGAFLFLIRVVDDARNEPPRDAVWRVVGNRSDLTSQLVRAEQAGPPLWESSFRIAHRINATLATGGVYFAGDAAHIHSPIGARGMNLGLEDAWVFSELVRTGRMSEYERLRRPIDRRVVRQVDLLSRIASAESPLFHFLRRFLFPVATSLPFIRSRMAAAVTGLDHSLPSLIAGITSR
jgi:2-polyprenyl-6-methoxyphenol hydroxylase-like FAD-dependent oxidoreductase